MWQPVVIPFLRPPQTHVTTRLLHLCGIPESDAAARLGQLMKRDAVPTVGITASGGILTIRIRGSDAAQVDAAATRTRELLQEHIFGEADDSLPRRIIELLTACNQRLAVAESCTGGLLGAMLTAAPGASSAFWGGIISYANDIKQSCLRVTASNLRDHGAVSEPVARQMAIGALDALGTDHALAITGIAGPDGGSPAKSVGTVFIGHAHRNRTTPATPPTVSVRRFVIPGSRDDVRSRAALSALTTLWFHLAAVTEDQQAPRRLLWEMPPTT